MPADDQRRALKTGAETLRPRARILRTFGDELISSETVAVVELVKNAYDADATRVLVRLRAPLRVGHGGIDVIDNGHGMTTDTMREAFMQPATLHRVQAKFSERFGRRVLGEKGIGRFAVSRLADELVLLTRRQGTRHETVATFDWTDFDAPDAFLDQVEVLWEETPPREITAVGMLGALPDNQDDIELDHGTVLRMERLRGDWNRAKIEQLRTVLSRLSAPFAEASGTGPARDFLIALEVPGPDADLSGVIEPPDALRNPHYLLRGGVQEDGRYEFVRRIGHDGDEETITGQLRRHDLQLPTCGPIELELRVWDRETGSLRDLALERHQTIRAFRRDLDELSGVSIYRDGFRVLPYGERDDDWLRLDLRRVNAPTLRLSNNQVAGYVAIGRDSNPELIDQTNREGLMQNRAYDDLRDIVRGALNEIEQPRARHRRRARRKPQGDGESTAHDLFEAFDITDVRDLAVTSHGDDIALLAAIDDAQTGMDEAVDEVREIIGTYGRLASLGRLVDTILHDGSEPLAAIDAAAALGQKDLDGATLHDRGLQVRLTERFTRIMEQAELLDALLRRLRPLAGRKRGRPKELVLERIVSDSVDVLRSKAAAGGVTILTPTTETVVTAEETDLRIVLWNLLDNAIYWVRRAREGDRVVEVLVKRADDGSIHIIVSDSGDGVDDDVRDTIFLPYVTKKPDGTGIGLAHAGDVLREYYDGELLLVDDGPQRGATFEAVIRRRTGSR